MSTAKTRCSICNATISLGDSCWPDGSGGTLCRVHAIGALAEELDRLRAQVARLTAERAAAVVVACKVADGDRTLPKQNTEKAVGILMRHYANNLPRAELDRVGKAAFGPQTPPAAHPSEAASS